MSRRAKQSFPVCLVPARSDEIDHYGKIKTYPDGKQVIFVADRPIFREPGYEDRRERNHVSLSRRSGGDLTPQEREQNIKRARSRARVKMRDICLCTDFWYFVTLTLNKDKINRYDAKKIIHRLNGWLSNRVQRNGLAYVLVPERHKDGAVHFHGFFNDALPVVDSGTISLPGQKQPKRWRSEAERQNWIAAGGRVVYNLPDWDLGFSTAIELYGDYDAAVNYTCKYLDKQTEKIGGRWYYSGGALGTPIISYTDALDWRQAVENGGKETPIPAAGLTLAVLETSL